MRADAELARLEARGAVGEQPAIVDLTQHVEVAPHGEHAARAGLEVDVAHVEEVVMAQYVDLLPCPRVIDRQKIDWAYHEAMAEVVGDGALDLAVELDDVPFCDSTGLGVLVGAHRSLAAHGGHLTVVHPRPTVRHLLVRSGLDRVFDVS